MQMYALGWVSAIVLSMSKQPNDDDGESSWLYRLTKEVQPKRGLKVEIKDLISPSVALLSALISFSSLWVSRDIQLASARALERRDARDHALELHKVVGPALQNYTHTLVGALSAGLSSSLDTWSLDPDGKARTLAFALFYVGIFCEDVPEDPESLRILINAHEAFKPLDEAKTYRGRVGLLLRFDINAQLIRLASRVKKSRLLISKAIDENILLTPKSLLPNLNALMLAMEKVEEDCGTLEGSADQFKVRTNDFLNGRLTREGQTLADLQAILVLALLQMLADEVHNLDLIMATAKQRIDSLRAVDDVGV